MTSVTDRGAKELIPPDTLWARKEDDRLVRTVLIARTAGPNDSLGQIWNRFQVIYRFTDGDYGHYGEPIEEFQKHFRRVE